MALELHLPDLTEGSIALGPAPARGLPPRPPLPWHQRLRELLATYLPLLLMLLLALGTWWLVKNTPPADEPREAAAPRQEPDYTMHDFVVERFDKNGRLKARLQGEQLRHYADRDLIEVDRARLRAVSAEGRVLLAQAQRALVNGDGSEVQLIGDSRVDSSGPKGEPVAFRGEFLHVFVNTERVRSHLPVVVTSDGSEFRAAGMDYDHLSGLLQLQGKMRAQLLPNAARKPQAADNAERGANKDPR
ncbi:MAG TPA: LPS export ABC transporter periplasmic protein LptC [Rubrivivax sp.]|nr:LPS export ABC transporter periplasmic protein LptC [Rubrivivax sp.]